LVSDSEFTFAHSLEGETGASTNTGFGLATVESQLIEFASLVARKHSEISIVVASHIICSHLKVCVDMIQQVFPCLNLPELVEQTLANLHLRYFIMIYPNKSQRLTRVKKVVPPFEAFRSLLGNKICLKIFY